MHVSACLYGGIPTHEMKIYKGMDSLKKKIVLENIKNHSTINFITKVYQNF